MQNAKALVVTSKEIGLEVKAVETKYMVMYREQIAWQSHNIKINNSSFARVVQFKYLGATLRNENSIQGEIKSTMKKGNAY